MILLDCPYCGRPCDMAQIAPGEAQVQCACGYRSAMGEWADTVRRHNRLASMAGNVSGTTQSEGGRESV